MSTIYMIRHGQASFGEKNYDKLSDTGVHQSVLLGRYLASLGVFFDSVYTGNLSRQKDTFAGIREGYSQKNEILPESETLDGLDEYNSEEIVRVLIPELIKNNPALAEDVKNVYTDRKAFMRLIEAVMLRWIEAGDLSLSTGWHGFCKKVNNAITAIIKKEGSGKNIMIVTSGGPLSVTLQRALDITDEKTMRLVWQIKNSSVTRFRYSGNHFMIESFNEVHHLEFEDRALVTYR